MFKNNIHKICILFFFVVNLHYKLKLIYNKNNIMGNRRDNMRHDEWQESQDKVYLERLTKSQQTQTEIDARFGSSFEKETIKPSSEIPIKNNRYKAKKVIESWQLGFNLSKAIKCISRASKNENKKEELEKAILYLQKEINSLI